jgi:GTP-binding protein
MKVNSAEFKYSAKTMASLPRPMLPEIAFMGRSNVGKSSLLNSLLGVTGLARTSSTPGRTQALNFFLINEAYYFVDLPGYGYAKVSKAERQAWGKLIENYLAQRECLVLSILIVDARHEPSPLDLQMKSWLEHFGLPYLVVTTKIDKLSTNERRASHKRAIKILATDHVIPYSSVTREGASQIWDQILASIAAKQ